MFALTLFVFFKIASANGGSTDKTAECIKSICPIDVSSSSAVLRASIGNKQVFDQYQKVVEPQVRKLAKSEIENKHQELSDGLQWLKTAPVIKDPKTIALYYYILADKLWTQFSFTEKDGKYVVDPVASRKTFPQFSDRDFKTLMDTVNAVIVDRQSLRSLEKAKTNAPLPETTKSFMDSEVSQLYLNAEAYRITYPVLKQLPYFNNLDPDLISALYSQASQGNEAAAAKAITAGGEVQFIDNMMRQPFRDEYSQPVDIGKQIRSLGWDKSLDRTSQRFVSPKSQGDQVQKAIGTCMTSYFTLSVALPSSEDASSLAKRIPDLKKNFLTGLQAYLSPASYSVISDDLSHAIENYGPNQDSETSKLQASLSNEQDFLDLRDPRLRGGLSSDEYYPLLLASNVGYNPSDLPVVKTCQNAIPNFISDYAYPGDPRSVFIGPQTMKTPEYSVGILYHEWGHLVDDIIRRDPRIDAATKEWWKKVMSCLAANHSDLDQETKDYDKEKIKSLQTSSYGGEDFADLSYYMASKAAPNPVCVFGDWGDPSSIRVTDLGLDSHSSTFYRLLYLEYLKKKSIPTSCQETLATKHQVFAVKDCAIPMNSAASTRTPTPSNR